MTRAVTIATTIGATIVKGPGPRLFRRLLVGAATTYFCVIFLEICKPNLAYAWVPGPLLYFSQIAALFPLAKSRDMDYRAEGWNCEAARYEEIDLRPIFSIQAENKENRFARAMYFYNGSPEILSRLSVFVQDKSNGRATVHPQARDSSDGGRLADEHPKALLKYGGVRLLGILSSIPQPSQGIKRYHRPELQDVAWEERRIYFEPSPLELWKACKEL